MTKITSYDIIIIGAGTSGLSLTREMADSGLRIAVLERSPLSRIADPAYDGREIALTHLSQQIMSDLGIWQNMPEDGISQIRYAKVLDGVSPYALTFSYEEAGEDTLGYMASNHIIKKATYDAVRDYDGVEILCDTEVSHVETDAARGTVTLKDGTCLSASLIVAADSRFSGARDMMDIPTSKKDFERTCIVCKMDVCGIDGRPNDTAYECFHYGRTLAVLPLNNNQVSVVITADTGDGQNILAMSAEDFAADIQSRIEGRFGDMSLASELYAYPLMGVFAKTFHAQRFALLGDAAVGMHPVTAHGFNLGLRGAHTLAGELRRALRTGGDIGGASVLARYSHKHRIATAPLYHGTNTLVKLFTDETPPAKLARGFLLRLGNRLKPAKRLIMNQLTESDAA